MDTSLPFGRLIALVACVALAVLAAREAAAQSAADEVVGDPVPAGPDVAPSSPDEAEVAADTDDEATGALSGVLLTRGTRVPLSSMFVTLERDDGEGGVERLETISDREGRFSFEELPAATWQLVVDEVGYVTYAIKERVEPGVETVVTCYVEEDLTGQYVSTTVASAPRREVTRRTITVDEIQQIAGNNNDAVRAVQNLPGVARASFGTGEIVVRGSEGNDTGFYIDGMRLPAVYHFGGLRSVVPSELIDGVDFYPGAFGAQFGRATGGVVNIRTRTDAAELTTGHVDVNLFDAGAFVRTPIGERFTLELGARRSYVDAVLAAVSGALPLQFATAPRYYDYQARLSFEASRDHTLRLFVLGSDDRLDFVLDEEESRPPSQRGGIAAATWFHGYVLSLESRLGPSVDNELRFQTQWQRLAFQFGEDFRFDLRNRLFAVRDTLSIRATDAVTVRYGLDIEVIAGRISVALPRPPREGDVPLGLDPASVIEARERALFYQPAHFAEVEVEPIESLRIVAGVRNEYYRTGRNWAVDGRFAVRWQALDRWLLKGGVSNHHTPPFFDERSESYGNPDLRPEHAIHAVLGSEITITDALTLDVELYYKDLRDLVAPTDEVTVRDGEEVPVVYDNSGRGRAYGAEVFLRHSFSRNFFGWLSYSIGRSERFDAERDAYRLFDFDQPHVLTALGTYRLPRNWSIGARFRLVSGNPYTPIVGAVYDADRGEYVRTPGRTNSERLPVFHQLDVRVDKRWIRDRRIASLYLDLQNAYNRQNPEGWSYSYDYAERARITGIPIFPALGFRVEW